MSLSKPIVYVMHGQETVRLSLCVLVQFMGLRAKSCRSFAEFLDRSEETVPCCLLLDDQAAPEQSLQQVIAGRLDVPVVIISDEHASTFTDYGKTVSVVKKPCTYDELCSGLQKALDVGSG